MLAKEGLAQPLLGRGFPGFYQLLAEAIQKKEDEEKKLAGLAEEAEDSMPIEVATEEPADTPVLVVQTRRQKVLEQKQGVDDDEATSASGAAPLDLMQLDDELFGESRARRRLSRAQKRAQATSRLQTPAPRTKHTAKSQLRQKNMAT